MHLKLSNLIYTAIMEKECPRSKHECVILVGDNLNVGFPGWYEQM